MSAVTARSSPGRHDARVAIEALRAGVPNRSAIRLLGIQEAEIGRRFADGIAALTSDRPAPGLLVAGGYGTGKSHLLGFLREEALRANCIVSWVTISKETPLSQPAAVYAAALRGALAQGRPEDAVRVALDLLVARPGAVQALEEWATQADLLPVFAAIAYLLGRPLPPELTHGIAAFLAGDKPPTQEVRTRLAQHGARGMFSLTGMKVAQLVVERPRFLARLFREAGFSGWVILFDEVELIGRYGAVQRAQAYAELGRWLGVAPAAPQDGLFSVAAIADDFAAEVIDARLDEEKLPERLRLKGLPRQADLALAAMAAIRDAPILRAHAAADLVRHGDVLRRCYSDAYDWPAPPATPAVREQRRTMRHHVRSWIIEWDMLRLFGSTGGVMVQPDGNTYVEDPDLALPPPDEEAG